MKKAFAILAQFLLFLAAFAAGIILGVFSPLHLQWFLTHPTPNTNRFFDPTGLLLMLLLYVLILLVEAARKRLRASGPRTTIALLLAAMVGFLMHFGSVGN